MTLDLRGLADPLVDQTEGRDFYRFLFRKR
jgi:hypothetical protein